MNILSRLTFLPHCPPPTSTKRLSRRREHYMRKKLQVEDEKKLCMKNSLPLAECIFFSEFIFLLFFGKNQQKKCEIYYHVFHCLLVVLNVF